MSKNSIFALKTDRTYPFSRQLFRHLQGFQKYQMLIFYNAKKIKHTDTPKFTF